MRQLATESAAVAPAGEVSGEAALAAVAALDPKTTEVLLEEEVREAVLSTAGTAAGAGRGTRRSVDAGGLSGARCVFAASAGASGMVQICASVPG